MRQTAYAPLRLIIILASCTIRTSMRAWVTLSSTQVSLSITTSRTISSGVSFGGLIYISTISNIYIYWIFHTDRIHVSPGRGFIIIIIIHRWFPRCHDDQMRDEPLKRYTPSNWRILIFMGESPGVSTELGAEATTITIRCYIYLVCYVFYKHVKKHPFFVKKLHGARKIECWVVVPVIWIHNCLVSVFDP